MPTNFAEGSSVPWRCQVSLRDYDGQRLYEAFHHFSREQSYQGEFLRDSLHGQGTYRWQNVAVYEGGFYCNCKEGYGSLSFPDNSYFEGLFIENKPFGPGVFTHSNGRQDAGFWKGKKLVRLSRAVDFIIPRLAPTSAAKIKLLQFRRLIPLNEENFSATNVLPQHEDRVENFLCKSRIYDPRSIFFDKKVFENAYFGHKKERQANFPAVEEIEENQAIVSITENPDPSRCLCPDEVFVMKYESEENVDICGEQSTSGDGEIGYLSYLRKFGVKEKQGSMEGEFGSDMQGVPFEDSDEERTESKIPKIVSWNRSELCTEMLKQIFRFRHFEGKLHFNVSKLMVGARTDFRKTGENEKQCIQFLKMCSLGPPHIVKGILCCYDISEELMDARGNNSIMFAAAADQCDVINILLDYGADVNAFNDEGLTPLNLCLLRRLAQANGISNWETAFLPKEIDEFPDEDSETQECPPQESISSLDRIFGDGMSMNDSNVMRLDSKSVISSSLTSRRHMERPQNPVKDSRESLRTWGLTSRSQASVNVVNWEWDSRIKRPSVTALSNPTPQLNVKIVPKSIRTDEFQKSVEKTNKDKYLFDLNFQNNPFSLREDSFNFSKRRISRKEKKQLAEDILTGEDGLKESSEVNDWSPELIQKISKIDNTIKFLLNRGADTNISEVPKPSIHLGIYTKDFGIVHSLLSHGANANSQLHSNDGLLTPLHVIVLRESAPQYYSMCQLLLKFKADPDKETLPQFSLYEEEKQYLDPEHGRTPLQLLCMRPDLEFADPNDHLLKIGLLLAKVGNRKLFYNGHSYLTLAMLFGNVKFLEALLLSEFFDPQEVLGKNRGTCLHVLVSSELQKRTPYETSIKMCKLLLRAGADPLKKFTSPRYLLGNCIDYGWREIEAQKEARKASGWDGNSKRLPRRQSSAQRDFFRDHERVVEYLARIVARKTKRKSTIKQSVDFGRRNRLSSEHSYSRRSRQVDNARPEEVNEEPKGVGTTGATEKGNSENQGDGVAEALEGETFGSQFPHSAVTKKKRRTRNTEGEVVGGTRAANEVKETTWDLTGNSSKQRREAQNSKFKNGGHAQETKKRGSIGKAKQKDGVNSEKTKDEVRSRDGKAAGKTPPGKKEKKENKENKERKGNLQKGMTKKEISDAKKSSTKSGEQKTSEKSNLGDKGVGHRKKESKQGIEKSSRSAVRITGRESEVLKVGKSSLRSVSDRTLGASDIFPEKLRQFFLRLYGCSKVDVNEFLMPYVVLRDGELYYKFKGKATKQKEQYSLV